MPWRWLSEGMYLAYASFAALLAVPPLALLLSGRLNQLRDLTFRLVLMYVSCCLIYLVYPVIGPTPMLPATAHLSSGLFYQLSADVQRLGDSLGTSFPSTHVAAATTIALGAWRWLARPIAWLITADAGAGALAAVYTQNHYAIDAVAGVLFALIVQLGLAPLVSHCLTGHPNQRGRVDVRRPPPDAGGA